MLSFSYFSPGRVLVRLDSIVLCGCTFEGKLYSPDFNQEYSNIGDPDLSSLIRALIIYFKSKVFSLNLIFTEAELAMIKKHRDTISYILKAEE